MSTFDIEEEYVTKFSYLIGYDVLTYFDLYRMFINNNFPLLLRYYQNSEEKPDQFSFSFLNKLKNESIVIDNMIKSNLQIFDNMWAWEILDFFEDSKIKIDTFLNLSRWTRSNKTTTGWDQIATQSPYVTGNYETLEQISEKIEGSNDSQNDWQKIALQNNLIELDYSTTGDKELNVSKRLNSNPNYFLNSVIDNLVEKRVYGRDIQKKLQFVNDDLLVLDYVDTVKQSVFILMSLRKGDVPEFPDLGINNLIGGNTASFFFVSLRNQLTNNFLSDDTLRNLNILSIYYKSSDIYIDFEVDTFYNLTINQTTKL